jgi:hypothetical protein
MVMSAMEKIMGRSIWVIILSYTSEVESNTCPLLHYRVCVI